MFSSWHLMVSGSYIQIIINLTEFLLIINESPFLYFISQIFNSLISQLFSHTYVPLDFQPIVIIKSIIFFIFIFFFNGILHIIFLLLLFSLNLFCNLKTHSNFSSLLLNSLFSDSSEFFFNLKAKMRETSAMNVQV